MNKPARNIFRSFFNRICHTTIIQDHCYCLLLLFNYPPSTSASLPPTYNN